MRNLTFTFEHFLYLLIFVIALGVRAIGIGQLPLSDFEADHAVRAVQVSRGEPAELGTQPGYVLLTGLTFFFTGSSELTARIWPVLVGSMLVGVPFFVREKLGRKAALAIAVGLAVDPGLVSISQIAGGPMMAVSFTLLAAVTWLCGWTIAGGVLAGLALLSGPGMMIGIISLAGAVGIVRVMGIFPARENETDAHEFSVQSRQGLSPQRAGLLAAGGTLLLAGTLFLRYPQGLSAFASALPAYLAGWTAPSGVAVGRLLVVLVSYPLLALVFGVLGIFKSWTEQNEGSQIGKGLSIWLGISLLVVLLYPGRQVVDLAWPLVPLWGLAGIAFSSFLHQDRGDAVAWGLAALVVIMYSSVWINLAGLTASNAQGQLLMLRWLVIGGAVLLAILSTVLVGLGWSSESAKRGFAWGTALALGVGMFSGVWGANQREITARTELWRPVPGSGQQNLFMQTLGDLGDWTVGREDSIQIISLVDAPSMRWALRDLPNVSFQTGLSREDLPEVIIARQEGEELSLGSAYRGQDFAWWVYPNWDVWTGMDWLKWLTFRQGGGGTQGIILWARGDLFPSGEATLDLEAPLEIDPTDEGEEFIPEEEILDREEPLK